MQKGRSYGKVSCLQNFRVLFIIFTPLRHHTTPLRHHSQKSLHHLRISLHHSHHLRFEWCFFVPNFALAFRDERQSCRPSFRQAEAEQNNEYSSKSSGTGRDHQRAKPEVRKRTDKQMQHHPASIRRQVRGHLRGHHAGQRGTVPILQGRPCGGSPPLHHPRVQRTGVSGHCGE